MMLSQSHEGTKKDGNPYKALTTESTENTEETMNLLRVGFGYVGFLLLFSVPSVSSVVNAFGFLGLLFVREAKSFLVQNTM
jgi:hypothetical protein